MLHFRGSPTTRPVPRRRPGIWAQNSRRATGALLCVALLASLLIGCARSDVQRSLPVIEGDVQAYEANVLPIATGETPTPDEAVVNSQRGQYIWLDVPEDPLGWPTVDVYWRDQLKWGAALEREAGVYDLSVVEEGLALAEQKGGRFNFRVMTYCPGCGENLAPAWLPRQATGAPDWNSDAFLSAWESLMKAIGQRFGDDARLGYIDLGGYGAAGEWYYEEKYGDPITDANARRMMRAVIDSFPNKFVLVPWMGQYPEMATALSQRVGIRNDCVGGFAQDYVSRTPAAQNAWRTAPMVGEWCNMPKASSSVGVDTIRSFHMSAVSSGNYPRRYTEMTNDEQAAFRQAHLIAGYRYTARRVSMPRDIGAGTSVTVATRWENSGSAGTYDEWVVSLQFTGVDGQTSFTVDLADDLRTVRDGVADFETSVSIPGDAKGRYRVALLISDPQGYLDAMRLAQTGRQEDGGYTLGHVVVGG